MVLVCSALLVPGILICAFMVVGSLPDIVALLFGPCPAAVVCYSSTWWAYLHVAVVALLLYVLGIPTTVLAVVHRYKNAINNKGPNGGPHPDHEWAEARFGPLCAPYKDVFEVRIPARERPCLVANAHRAVLL